MGQKIIQCYKNTTGPANATRSDAELRLWETNEPLGPPIRNTQQRVERLHLRTVHRTAACSRATCFTESRELRLLQGPAALFPTRQPPRSRSAHHAWRSSPRPGAWSPIPAHLPVPAAAENPPKTPTHFAVKLFFLRLRIAIFCLNFIRHGAHPARLRKKKLKENQLLFTQCFTATRQKRGPRLGRPS